MCRTCSLLSTWRPPRRWRAWQRRRMLSHCSPHTASSAWGTCSPCWRRVECGCTCTTTQTRCSRSEGFEAHCSACARHLLHFHHRRADRSPCVSVISQVDWSLFAEPSSASLACGRSSPVPRSRAPSAALGKQCTSRTASPRRRHDASLTAAGVANSRRIGMAHRAWMCSGCGCKSYQGATRLAP
jgi:hypothetical protein